MQKRVHNRFQNQVKGSEGLKYGLKAKYCSEVRCHYYNGGSK